MISIIIPVYNAEGVIGRCIESVLSQDYKNWELILVDDGSSDNSKNICEEYANSDIRISVIRQENQGPSVTRNTGILASKGDYLCFIDADDYVSRNYLSDFHVEYDLDISIQGMRLEYTDGRETELFKPDKSELCSLQKSLENCSIFPLLCGPCCKLFKASIIKNKSILFPLSIRYGEDRIFVLRYLQYCKTDLFLSSTTNYTYTHENNNSLTSVRKKSFELLQSAFLQYQELMNLNNQVKSIALLSYYRKELMHDTYQSVYNNIIENRFDFQTIYLFVKSIDKELLRFVNKETSYPLTFKFLRLAVKLLRLGK